MSTSPENITVNLAQLRHALAATPYSASIHPRTDRIESGADLLDWLDKLRETLEVEGERGRARDKRLYELEAQKRAIRAFLGTGAPA
jgi:hypothetical protein